MIKLLFLILGTVIIIYDGNLVLGGQYLITAIVFALTAFTIFKRKTHIKNSFFSIGFILSIVGLNIGPEIWLLGIILLLISLHKKIEK